MANEPETHKAAGPHVPERRRRTPEDMVGDLEARLMAAIHDGDRAVETKLMTRMQTLEVSFTSAVLDTKNEILAHLQKQDTQAATIEAKVDAHEVVLRTKQAEDDEQARAKAERDHDEKLIADHESLRLAREIEERAARLKAFNKVIVPIYGALPAALIGAFVELFNAVSTNGLRWNGQAYLILGLVVLSACLSMLLVRFG